MRNKKNTHRVLITGNEAMGEASVRAGCRFYAGYPITPQNELIGYMSKRMPQVGGVFIQAESELAAINMVFGASCTGARSMTSSSSPGISLKQEGISYLAACQLPCLIINVSRGGPGLGNIASSQSDYFQSTRGGGHGDYRIIVLSPFSVQEAVDLVFLGFDLADKYRIPCMILTEAILGQMMEPVSFPDFIDVKSVSRNKDWILDGAKSRKKRIICSLFLEEGVLERHNLVLQQKYKEISNAESRAYTYKTEDANYLITGFGIQARICREAVDILRDRGIKVGLFRPITLWPFPYQELQKISSNIKRVLVVEQNYGQMLEDIKLGLPHKEVYFLGRGGGGVPTVLEIIEKMDKII